MHGAQTGEPMHNALGSSVALFEFCLEGSYLLHGAADIQLIAIICTQVVC